MTEDGSSQRSIGRQTSVHRALLVLYLASFLKELGRDMVQVFGDRFRHDAHTAATSQLRMWTSTLVDLAMTATQLRMKGPEEARTGTRAVGRRLFSALLTLPWVPE